MIYVAELSLNLFDNEKGIFCDQRRGLVFDEGQYSLWPTFAEVPAGWTIVHAAETRKSCLDYVEEHWTDMRPKSLIEQMECARKSHIDT